MKIYSLIIFLSQFWTSQLFHVWFQLLLLDLHTGFSGEDKMIWYSHHFRNFPQCVVTHTVKGFRVVNETEIDVFLEFPCFLYDPMNAANLISGSSAFSKPSLNIWKFLVPLCWSLAWRILSITLLAWQMSTTVWESQHSLVLPFLGIGMKTDLFQSCSHGWVFQIGWHIECNTWITSYFRVLNSSAGIPWPPRALLATVLPY